MVTMSTSPSPRRSGAQLITYPDSLGGGLAALEQLLADELDGAFTGGVHVLPPYPSSGDRGFAPITYFEIDPAFGTWADLSAVAAHGGLTVDVMVNHVSRQSEEFQAFAAKGRESDAADLFITLDKVWPDGVPPADDVAAIFLRKPEHPFSDIEIEATGDVERIWTSFGPRVDWSEQIDLDVTSAATWELFSRWFAHLESYGVTTVRLDAVGYVVKRAGTSCFMVEPEIWAFLERVTALAADHGLDVLPEVHDVRPTFEAITARGHVTYNFVLPGLILHALVAGRADLLRAELQRCPAAQVTMLDCHDGIPVQPDLVGVLPEAEMHRLVDACLARGANVNRILGLPEGAFDAHQINITYPSACGSDEAYLTARAIQVFAPGTPQIYHVGLLGGHNDLAAIEEQGEARAINRHNYSLAEARQALATPVARAQLALLRLRNQHPAFSGSCTVHEAAADDPTVTITWEHGGATCTLVADVAAGTHRIDHTP